jgi:hypothetical protein
MVQHFSGSCTMDNTALTEKESEAACDLVWGAEAIGREINRSKSQVYHLVAIGALDSAVAKLGHKTIVASRKALRNLPFRK